MRIFHAISVRRMVSGLILLVVLLPRPAHAQNAAPAERLLYGDTLTRSFSAEPDALPFSFYAVEGDSVTITLVATDADTLDPALVLLDSTGKRIAQNDDSFDDRFGLTNARLINFPVPSDGLYTILATRDAAAEGEFTLAIRARRANDSRATLESPGTAKGQISADISILTYEFRASAGEILSFEVKAASGTRFTPTLTLLDGQNAEVQTYTPGKLLTTASLPRVLIRRDDIYSLVISGAKSGGAASIGRFDVTVKRDLKAALIAYGTPLTGALTTALSEVRYVFAGTAGDVVTISMLNTSGKLDPALKLLTLDNRQLVANNDATGEGLKKGDARIVKFKLPTTDLYVIAAGRTGRDAGEFTVSVEK